MMLQENRAQVELLKWKKRKETKHVRGSWFLFLQENAFFYFFEKIPKGQDKFTVCNEEIGLNRLSTHMPRRNNLIC